MKKLLFLLPITALLITSCTNDENINKLVSKKEVGVRPLVSGTTRGEAITLANLKEFRVFAVNKNEASPAIEENFTDVVSATDEGIWAMSTPHYWMSDPVNGSQSYGSNVANFTGVYPKDLVTETTLPATMALNLSTPDGRDLKDILVAYFSGTRDGNVTSGVPLHFKHVLSQIVVKARNGSTDVRKVEIIGVKLCTVKPGATLTFPTANTNEANTYEPISNVTGDALSYIINHDNASDVIELTSEAQNIMFDAEGTQGGFMVIPQTFNSPSDSYLLSTNDTYISVLCRIYKKNDAGEWEVLFPKSGASGQYAFTSVGISGKWEPGKKYIYTLNFYEGNGGAGVIDPDPKDPSDPDNPEVDNTPDDPDNPSGEVDDEQSKMPIIFTVTVEDWQDGNGSSDDFNKILD